MTVSEYYDRMEHDSCPECGSDKVVPIFPLKNYLHWHEGCKRCEWEGELKQK